LRTPFGVAVAGGRVYVADFGNDRVQIFGTDGTALGSVGGRGTGDGQFQRPAGVAVDRDGGLYVTDHFNDRVQKFSSDGKFVAQLGSVPLAATVAIAGTPVATPQPTATPQPPAEAQLQRPEGIAVDREGALWVADYGRDRVVKLAPDGRLLLAVGGAGEFLGPKGVAVDPNSGRIYVADTGNARVQRLAPDGSLELTIPLPLPTGAAATTTPTVLPATTPTPVPAAT
jgi:DNA-binding beta-propeller fold protein YncE